MIKISPLLFLLCVLSLASFGQRQALAEPVADEQIKSLFAEHIRAFKESDFQALADQIHPGEAEAYKKKFVSLANLALDHGEFGKFARMFPWVNSVQQIEKTPATNILSKTLSSTVGADPGFRHAVKKANVTLLGQVSEGEGEDLQIHLIYRMVMPVKGNKVETIELVTVRKAEDDRFYLTVEPKAKAIIDALLKHYDTRL